MKQTHSEREVGAQEGDKLTHNPRPEVVQVAFLYLNPKPTYRYFVANSLIDARTPRRVSNIKLIAL